MFETFALKNVLTEVSEKGKLHLLLALSWNLWCDKVKSVG